MMHKVCSKCKVEKSVSEFKKHRSHSDGLSSQCKGCVREKRQTKEYRQQSLLQQRRWRAENKDRVNAWSRKFRESEYGQKWIRNDSLKRTYGITLEHYESMWVKQNGKCAICGKHESEFSKRLCVDHNHWFGDIRELLCHHCNTGLGSFNEDIFLMKRAIKYLRKHLKSNKDKIICQR